MKIAILSPFYPYRGGLAQLNARLYTELSKQNTVKAFTFTTLYPEFLFPGKTQYVEEGDTATVIDAERVLNSVNPLSYVKTAKAINRFTPDILIIPYWMSFLAPAFGGVCLFLDKSIKVVALVHNALPHERRFFDKAFSSFFFNRCNGFLVMSEPVVRDLKLLKPDANILLLPHPIYDHYGDRIDKAEACKELNVKSDKKTLLFFGLIRDYKGLDLLIDAFGQLDDSYQLVIAGESYGSFDKYTAQIENSPQKENVVVYEQYIHDDMVPLLFSAADVLVLPYRSATQSGVTALSIQLELPMVATDVGALGKTIRDAEIGFVVAKPLAEDISRGIKEYFADAEKVKDYNQNLRSEKKRLSWANFIVSVQHFLNTL